MRDEQFETPIRMQASDGVTLGGFVWGHGTASTCRAVVVISAATSVRCRYYSRFAKYLYVNGFDVITYDYRGIGESRPKSLRGFPADWVDWGEKDLEAALRYAMGEFPNQPIHVVAHSIGGFAIGLAPSNRQIKRIFMVGSQYAYWRDYGPAHRSRMYVKWHIAMPLLTKLFGYFPAKRLGWMEDTPAGVSRDWSRMKAQFEDTVRPDMFVGGKRESELLRQRFLEVTAPILALGLGDDPHGTPAAIDRLLGYYKSSPRHHWSLSPSDIGVGSIGHFAFFHDRFQASLWPLALAWLETGIVPSGWPGRLLNQSNPVEGR